MHHLSTININPSSFFSLSGQFCWFCTQLMWSTPVFIIPCGFLLFSLVWFVLDLHEVPKMSNNHSQSFCPICFQTRRAQFYGYAYHKESVLMEACMIHFWKGQGRQGIFSLVNSTLWRNCKFYTRSISRAPRQWQGGTEAIAFVASVKYQAYS